MLFKGVNDYMHILVDANWLLWDEKNEGIDRLIGEVGLAIAIWGCDSSTLGILEELIL